MVYRSDLHVARRGKPGNITSPLLTPEHVFATDCGRYPLLFYTICLRAYCVAYTRVPAYFNVNMKRGDILLRSQADCYLECIN